MHRPAFSLTKFFLPGLALGLLLSSCGDNSTTGPDPSESDPSEPDPNQAPSAEIISPEGGASFTEGDTVEFEGEATDPEDGELSGSSLVWESDLDGQIGTGASFTRSDLSVGEHTITLTATDSDGASDTHEVVSTVEQKIVAPTVELGVKLPRPDLAFADSSEIADGEAVTLAWSLEDDPDVNDTPETCTASGGWSGEKSTAGDTVETAGLSGPANPRFILRCENSAGADADTVFVDVGTPGKRHAVSNRPDGTDAKQVKFFYITCEGCRDRGLDLDGSLEENFKKFQDRFEEETGERFRVDTYVDSNGDKQYDITFMVVDTTKGLSINDVVRKEMKERGLYRRPENGGYWTLIHYYDGPNEGSCTGGWANEVTIKTGNCRPTPTTVGHKLLHGLYLVDKDAPNADDEHHVTDHEDDLMDNTPGKSFSEEFIIDFNRDDYFCPDGCGEGVENLYGHPIFINP